VAYRTITLGIEAGVARLTLNRPDRLNSFNVEMHEEVRAALDAVASPPSGARVLVLTGAGRGFCAGQDLSDRAVAPGGAAVDLGDSIEQRYKPLVLALRALPMPVIAAVNGVAAGAGANIALACDLVIATRSASFIQSFAKIGLIPDCDLDKVSAVGNAAGAGARMALLNRGYRREIEDTVSKIEKIETALEPKFQEHFVYAMALPNKVDPFPKLSAAVKLPPRKTVSEDGVAGDAAPRRRSREGHAARRSRE